MSIEMSSGCRDVEPEGLMSSAVQWSEEPLGIPNINGDQLSKRRFWLDQEHRTLLLFAREREKKEMCVRIPNIIILEAFNARLKKLMKDN